MLLPSGNINPSASCILESYIEIVNFTFLCGASKGFMKVFKAFVKLFKTPQSSVKIKILVNFISSSGIGVGMVKTGALYCFYT